MKVVGPSSIKQDPRFRRFSFQEDKQKASPDDDEECWYQDDDRYPLLSDWEKVDFLNGRKAQARVKSLKILLGVCALTVVAFLIAIICLAVELAKTKNAEGTLAVSPATQPTFPPIPPYDSILGTYPFAAVAADNGLCSEIGRNVLLRGGNAADAVIATEICTGVIDAHSSGVGGGFFLTYYNAQQKQCYIVDAREEAPSMASRDMYNTTPTGSTYGWNAIAVPGDIHGLWHIYQALGSQNVPWSELLQPTIDLLEYGYPVSGALAKAIAAQASYINRTNSLRIFINNVTGQLYKAGEIMKRPVFADTMRQLANAPDPASLFYNGSIGRNLINEIRANGGIMSADDLQMYRTKVRTAMYSDMGNGLRICGPPPPASAAVVASILGVLGGFNFNSQTMSTINSSVLAYHKIIEAFKFGYAARSDLADITFVPSANAVAQNITSKTYIDQIRSMITDYAHPLSYYGGNYLPEDHGTAHMSIVDQFGNAASLTSTINFYFGSKMRSESTGIILNNEMDDFSQPGRSNGFGYAPSAANYIEPGKRPQSSMTPVVIYNQTTGDVRLVTGAAGGSRIITTTAQVAIRALFFNESIKSAIDARRLHNQLIPEYTNFEDGFPMLYANMLNNSYGQDMRWEAVSLSVATGIKRLPDGRLEANSDVRKPGGYPAGF